MSRRNQKDNKVQREELIDKYSSNTEKKDDNHSSQVIYTKQVGCLDLKSIVINLVIYTVVLMVTSGLFDGFYINGFLGAVETAFIMTCLNIILKPLLVIITLPLTLLTFGMFYVVINGFLLWIADDLMGATFEINSFFLAVLASIFISLLRLGINHYILKEDVIKVSK